MPFFVDRVGLAPLADLPVTPGLADTGNPVTNGTNLQTAINNAAYGDTLVLQAGTVYRTSGAFVSFTLPNKGTPPTHTDRDYITLTTSKPSKTPAALSNYPASLTRITSDMAALMPRIETQGSVCAFNFNNGTKYWNIERLNITNIDTGTQCITLVNQDDPAGLTDYPDRVKFRYNWFHPVEETGLKMDGANLARTVENAMYLQATNVEIRYNAFQGFAGQVKYGGSAGSPITSSNLLLARYAANYVVEYNLLEAWTYAFFTGGSSMPDWLVTKGGTVSSCDSTSCVFSTTTGLSIGDPVSVQISNATPAQCDGIVSPGCWGAAYVSNIVGSTVTFVNPLCHSYDGNNTCTSVGVVPVDGNKARWAGLQPDNMLFQKNIFAHYQEWTDLIDGVNCGGKGYLEVKSCTNCVFNGNIFTGCSGMTITLRNQGADFAWVSMDGLTFSNNYFRNSNNSMVGVLDDSSPAKKSKNVTWTNNLMVGLAPTLNTFFKGGELGQFMGGDHATVTHNTILWRNPNASGHSELPDPVNNQKNFTSRAYRTMTNLTMQNNFFGLAFNTCFLDATLTTTGTMDNCWPSATVDHNVLFNLDGYASGVGYDNSWTTPFPSQTILTSTDAAGFTYAPTALDDTGNYRLLSTSAYYRAGSDGTDIGCNVDAINAALGFRAA